MSEHTHGTEHVIKRFHPHRLTFFIFYFMGAIFLVIGLWYFRPLIWAGLLIAALGEVSRLSETFYILDTGVAREYRLFSTSRKFAEYEKLQNIEVNQSMFENIFGIGTVMFDTAGGHHMEIRFYGAENPYQIEKIVREKMSNNVPHV